MANESQGSNASLVAVFPSESLVFKLERNVASRVILKVSNISKNKVLFKVKTTQPSWYYVRPNQQILEIGQSEDVAIVLVDTESNRFLDQLLDDKPEKLDKHRFLVQSRALTDDEFIHIKNSNPTQRTEEFTKIWEISQKDEKKNIKLKVEFQYPSADKLSSGSMSQQQVIPEVLPVETKGGSTNISENVENVRSKYAKISSSIPDNNPGNIGGGADSVRNEFEGLRKKYDAVVDYTVHLTAERDTIIAQLEECQRELSRELAMKKRGGGVSSEGIATGSSVKHADKLDKDKRITHQGFSVMVLIVVAFLSFILGKYIL